MVPGSSPGRPTSFVFSLRLTQKLSRRSLWRSRTFASTPAPGRELRPGKPGHGRPEPKDHKCVNVYVAPIPSGTCLIDGVCYSNGQDNPNNACEYCDAGFSSNTWHSKNCTHPNACTIATCDPASGCVFTARVCDDGTACTTDTCNSVSGCVFTARVCDDGTACTTDTCNSASGCVFTPRVCNDGIACTTDTCNSVSGCVFTPRLCDDGIACTTDYCEAETGFCQNVPSCSGGRTYSCNIFESCWSNEFCNYSTGECMTTNCCD